MCGIMDDYDLVDTLILSKACSNAYHKCASPVTCMRDTIDFAYELLVTSEKQEALGFYTFASAGSYNCVANCVP